MNRARVRSHGQAGVVVLRMSDEESANMLDAPLIGSLHRAFRRVPDGRPIVLTGSGDSFSIGRSRTDGLGALEAFDDLVRWLRRSRRRTVAAVNGVATGWGLALALALDWRVASPQSSFSLGFLQTEDVAYSDALLSLIAEHLSAQQMRRVVLTNAVLSAAEARRLGLIGEVVPERSLISSAVARAQM